MNKKFLVLTASCLIGLLTAAVYAARLQHLRNEIRGLTEKMPVLTTVRDISPGQSLEHEDLATDFRIKNQALKRTIAPEDIDLIIGKKAFHPIPAGETILWTDLPEGPRLRKPSEKIPAGFRAISLPADEIHTMVHFITPGDSVDILSSSFTEGTGKIDSRLIAENITVLCVGQRFEEWSQPEIGEVFPLSVTILTAPEEAIRILKAAQSGEIHFLAKGSRLLPTISGRKEGPDSKGTAEDY